MINLSKATFTIPVRYDSNDRLENLSLILDYLFHNFKTNVIVLEDGSVPKFDTVCNRPNVHYNFVACDNPHFHRTKYLNDMAKMCDTPIIVNYDADVLFEPWAYELSVNTILNDKADMVYPYAGPFLECVDRTGFIEGIKQSWDFQHVTGKDYRVFNKNSVGGAIFWNREKFNEIGMENENFISWGHEDFERFTRAKKLGLKIARLKGNLLHVGHFRTPAGSTGNHDMYKNNESEFVKIRDMNVEQLSAYINTWEWINAS